MVVCGWLGCVDIGLFGVLVMRSAATAVVILAVARAEMMYIDYPSRRRGVVEARHGDICVYDSSGPRSISSTCICFAFLLPHIHNLSFVFFPVFVSSLCSSITLLRYLSWFSTYRLDVI